MTKFNKYTATQEVVAAYLDLEFVWDVTDLMEFLDNYKLNYRVGKITNPDHSNAQHYYLEMLTGVTDEESGEDTWVHIPHHTYLVVSSEDDRVAVTIASIEDFERVYRKIEDES